MFHNSFNNQFEVLLLIYNINPRVSPHSIGEKIISQCTVRINHFYYNTIFFLVLWFYQFSPLNLDK